MLKIGRHSNDNILQGLCHYERNRTVKGDIDLSKSCKDCP
jgi:hypothetical protein